MRRTMAVVCLTASLAWAQDPVKVAGSQYRLIAENEDVRLLAVDVAPGAKTVMHSHPDLMAVML
jgi:quercetin dioxygenase-like cupin family protein